MTISDGLDPRVVEHGLSAELLLEVVDAAADSVMILDRDGRILAWNTASETLYGWRREQAVGRDADRLLQSWHPRLAGRTDTLLGEADTWEGELKRVTVTGEERRVEVRWRRILEPDRGVPLLIEYGRDITRLPALESEARLTAYRYRNLFQAMAAAFWELDFTEVRQMIHGLIKGGVTDLPGHFAANPEFIDAAIAATRVIDVNDKTVELFGGPNRDALIGASVDPFWPKESRHIYAGALLAAASRAPRYSVETRLSRQDGALFDALFTVCWPDAHRGDGSVLVGVIDISDRVAAEARQRRSDLQYRTLFHALPMAVFQMDTRGIQGMLADLRRQGVTDVAAHLADHPDLVDRALEASVVADVNAACVRMFGAREPGDLIGLPSAAFWPSSGLGTFQRILGAAFAMATGFEEDTRMRRLDGSEIDVHYLSHAPEELRSQGMVVSVVADIGERLAAQRAVAQLRADFAHASRLSILGELTSSIAHEVNQPLAAIAANGAAGGRWLAREVPDLEEVRAINERIVADARRAADIIARVRAMAVKDEPSYEPVCVAELIEEAVRFLGHELQAHGVEVALDLPRDLPAVRADRIQVQQVVVNLAMNALQEMTRAGVATPGIHIRARAEVEGVIGIEVEDRGPGIASEHVDRLFESFFTTKKTGLGMGLAICRSIVEAHHGRIRAENRPGGACFSFTLPVAGD
ncbi:PAS domain-containing sensor histidine kinase [Thalassobaculum sp.]|uniref:PAS domain-containing sensor histidine kinase n=1 Tax=Thalassobaculum sp. TaxID=2022740 RepID=UPI003B59BC55